MRIASKSGANCVFSWLNRNIFSPNRVQGPTSKVQGPLSHLDFGLWTWNFGQLSLDCAGDQRFANTLFKSVAISGDFLINQLHVETERLQLAHEHIERLG